VQDLARYRATVGNIHVHPEIPFITIDQENHGDFKGLKTVEDVTTFVLL